METPRPTIARGDSSAESSQPPESSQPRGPLPQSDAPSTESQGNPLPLAGPGNDAAFIRTLDALSLRQEADEKAETVIRRPEGGSSVRSLTRASASSPADVASVLLGRQLSHFHLEELIGGGGMGAVFRARDERLDRTVAIKVIPFIGDDPDMQRRFRNEAQAAARLDHPNIARVYDVGMFEGWRYIVFEHIEGINIRDLVTRDGVLSIDDAVFCTRQIAEALHHASGRGVVHRDVKPSNILVNTEGETKLVDMGLARNDQLEISGDMTASGVTLGTFDYISPEQARDPRDADVRSDIYSLGCTLHFMLTGEPPYPGGTVLQKLLNHGNAPPPDPTLIRPDVSGDLKAILHKMLAKSPDLRYHRAIDLVADLRELANREGLVRAGSQGTLAITREDLTVGSWVTYLPWLVAAGVLVLGGVFLQLIASLREDAFVLDVPGSAVAIRQVDQEPVTRPLPEERPAESRPPTPSPAGDPPVNPTPPDSPGPPLTAKAAAADSASAVENTATEPVVMPTDKPPGSDSLAADDGSPQPAEENGSLPTDVAVVGPRFSEIAMPRENSPAPGVVSPAESPAPAKIDRIVISPADRSWPENVRTAETLVDALRQADELGVNEIEIAVPTIDSPPIRIPRDGLVIRSIVGATEIRFISESKPTMNRAVMIDVGPYRIDFQNLHFNWQVRSASIDGGCLFALTDNRSVRLTNCTITIENLAEREDVFAFEIDGPVGLAGVIGELGQDPYGLRTASEPNGQSKESDGRPPGRTSSPRTPLPPLVAIELNHVACRGEMTLIRLSDFLQLQFRWDDGLLAVSGRMLDIAGPDRESGVGGTQVQMRLSRLTASTGQGLVRTRLATAEGQPILIDRDAQNVVFRSPSAAPHVEFLGLETALESPDMWVTLRGEDNAYDLEPEGDWPILDLTMADGEREVFWMSQMIIPSRPPWVAERSPSWVVRWSDPVDESLPPSQRVLSDFYQDGTVVPGFDRTSLPNFPQPPGFSPVLSESPPTVP